MFESSIWGISPPLKYKRLLQGIFSGAPFLPLIELLLVAKICPLLNFFGASKLADTGRPLTLNPYSMTQVSELFFLRYLNNIKGKEFQPSLRPSGS